MHTYNIYNIQVFIIHTDFSIPAYMCTHRIHKEIDLFMYIFIHINTTFIQSMWGSPWSAALQISSSLSRWFWPPMLTNTTLRITFANWGWTLLLPSSRVLSTSLLSSLSWSVISISLSLFVHSSKLATAVLVAYVDRFKFMSIQKRCGYWIFHQSVVPYLDIPKSIHA